ncbi:MAG: hypothetical protein ACUVUE_07575 [Candidatus Bathycorpusculaceae bacterium]
MDFSKKLILVVLGLTIVSIYLTVYTLVAYAVATRYIYEDPNGEVIAWRTGPSGSLFPWPTEPGMLEVLSKVNEVDLFIYRYFIKTWALASLSILMWIATGLAIVRMAKL